MNNVKKFVQKVIELEALGVPVEVSAKALSEIYLIELQNFSEYFAALHNPEYLMLKNLNDIVSVINWQSAYGKTIFGKTEVEALVLDAKEKAYNCLTKILEEGVTIENALRHKTEPYIKTILGFMYYFGLGRAQDKKIGMNYLNCAANDKMLDALLWRLWTTPEKAEEIICDMAILPEFLAEPTMLEIWEKHYGINKIIDVNLLDISKIGF